MSFAPVFQPLLGPIDHASEALIRFCLADDVPADANAQKDFFDPDLSAIPKRKHNHLRSHAERLKRFLVHNSPLMAPGLLIFCLEQAEPGRPALPGLFSAIREHFAPLTDSDLKALVETYYNFRNTFIAHQKEETELIDLGATRSALQTWTDTLQALHQAVQSPAR